MKTYKALVEWFNTVKVFEVKTWKEYCNSYQLTLENDTIIYVPQNKTIIIETNEDNIETDDIITDLTNGGYTNSNKGREIKTTTIINGTPSDIILDASFNPFSHLFENSFINSDDIVEIGEKDYE